MKFPSKFFGVATRDPYIFALKIKGVRELIMFQRVEHRRWFSKNLMNDNVQVDNLNKVDGRWQSACNCPECHYRGLGL